RLQTERHPWVMFGGSIALGCASSILLDQISHVSEPLHEPRSNVPPALGNGRQNGEASAGTLQVPRQLDWLSSLMDEFRPQLTKLKGLAIGAAMGVVRDIVAESIPEPIRPQFTDVMNEMTVKVGGEPIHSSLIQSHSQEPTSSTGERYEDPYSSEMGRPM